MTVKELIEELQKYPPNSTVLVGGSSGNDHGWWYDIFPILEQKHVWQGISYPCREDMIRDSNVTLETEEDPGTSVCISPLW